MSARIGAAFAAARREGRAALMPYMMSGFPDRETSAAVIDAYADAGADLIELGVPYSDPLADGPVIHDAATRALAAGATLESALADCERVAAQVPVIPMAYANMILARGPKRFARELADAGAAGAIVPDLPLEEGGEVGRRAAQRRPGADPARGADDAAGAPGAHLRRGRGLRLPGLRHPDDRRARQPARIARRADRGDQGRFAGPGRGGLRNRHARSRPRRLARSRTA